MPSMTHWSQPMILKNISRKNWKPRARQGSGFNRSDVFRTEALWLNLTQKRRWLNLRPSWNNIRSLKSDHLGRNILGWWHMGCRQRLLRLTSLKPFSITNQTKKNWATSTWVEYLHMIFCKCFQYGYFPRPWKGIQGTPYLLYKGDEKPIDIPSSYRIVQLLDCEGKGLERLTKAGLENHISLEPEQYGFIKHRSTTDALIIRLINEAHRPYEKYVMLISIDISGAFDNLWWPSLIEEIKSYNVPGNLFRLLKSYLKGRTTTIQEAGYKVQQLNSTGCPQGSVLRTIFMERGCQSRNLNKQE